MSRPPRPPRLVFKRAARGRKAVWVIREGALRESTRTDKCERAGAEKARAQYIDDKYTCPKGVTAAKLSIDEVVAAHLKHHAPQSQSREFLMDTATPIAQWWSGKPLSGVHGTNCRRCVAWRTTQTRTRHANATKPKVPISNQMVRHDLKTLRAAINWLDDEIRTATECRRQK